MSRERALELLRGGEQGVKAWNEWCSTKRTVLPDLRRAKLRRADMHGAMLREILLTGADLIQSNLTGAELERADLSRSSPIGADFRNARLSDANLRRANLSGANLCQAELRNVPLNEANLRGAVMRRADLRGAVLRRCHLGAADLSETDLRGANLARVDLSEAKLCDADLRGANLSDGHLFRTDLRKALLEGAVLGGVRLVGSDLRDADLTRADLREAELRDTRLAGVKLSDALFAYTTLADLDLSVAPDALRTVFHAGPSTIGTDTLTKSRGKIPVEFLRGCGLRDWEIGVAELYDLTLDEKKRRALCIELAKLQQKTRTPDRSVFIAYTPSDRAFVQKVYAGLQNSGVRCWFAPHDAEAAQQTQQLERSVNAKNQVIVVLSESSMVCQGMKSTILNACREEAEEGRAVLFPIRLVPLESIRNWKLPGTGMRKEQAERLRAESMLDFTGWLDPDKYQPELERLIETLSGQGGTLSGRT